MIRKILMLVSISLFVLVGCNNQQASNIKEITAEEAKSLIDGEAYDVILDVRTIDEYNEGHIENAILLSDYEIEERAEEVLPDKEAHILIYCRSGRRSKLAAEKLEALGYTNLYDFGGINDWPYEVI